MSPDFGLSENFSQLNSGSPSDRNITEEVIGFLIVHYKVTRYFHPPVSDGIHFDHWIQRVSARILHCKVPLLPFVIDKHLLILVVNIIN